MSLKYILNFFLFVNIFINIFAISLKPIDYNNYSVYRVIAKNQKQFQFINEWTNNVTNDDLLLNLINIWKYPTHVSQQIDFMIKSDIKSQILQTFKNENFSEPRLLIKNVNTLIVNEEKSEFLSEKNQQNYSSSADENKGILDQFWEQWNQNIFVPQKPHKPTTNATNNIVSITGTPFFKTFESIEKIYEFMDSMVSMDSNNIEIKSIGLSSEQRQLKIIKIGLSTNKPIVWIDGGTHAREWLSITTALYIAYQLSSARNKCFVLNSNECSQELKELLNHYEFHIQPVINPDGYTYSRQRDRMWRKTRSKRNPSCIGVDPNRNYDISFGGVGTSSNPCSDQYHGGTAFSEPETASQRNHIMNIRNRLQLFVSFHTYSQLLLYPWSYTTRPSQHAQALSRVAQIGYKALNSVYGTEYRLGTASTILYSASGSASDWAHSIGIKYAYTFELRDKGVFGFIAPSNQIIPCGSETFEAIKAMLNTIKNEN